MCIQSTRSIDRSMDDGYGTNPAAAIRRGSRRCLKRKKERKKECEILMDICNVHVHTCPHFVEMSNFMERYLSYLVVLFYETSRL